MTVESGLENGLLLRTLTDPDTGLPSVLYFRLVRDWEERRAARHGGVVRSIRILVRGGDDASCRRFTFGLCHEFRKTDLLASSGRGQYRLLLVGRDAENAEAIRARVTRLGQDTNARCSEGGSIAVEVSLDEPTPVTVRDAHEPPAIPRLENTGERPRFAPDPEARP